MDDGRPVGGGAVAAPVGAGTGNQIFLQKSVVGQFCAQHENETYLVYILESSLPILLTLVIYSVGFLG